MKEQISICKRNSDGTLRVIGRKSLMTTLDESTMTLLATYKGKQYTVDGNYILGYIIVE
jgi:hypothetical protein